MDIYANPPTNRYDLASHIQCDAVVLKAQQVALDGRSYHIKAKQVLSIEAEYLIVAGDFIEVDQGGTLSLKIKRLVCRPSVPEGIKKLLMEAAKVGAQGETFHLDLTRGALDKTVKDFHEVADEPVIDKVRPYADPVQELKDRQVRLEASARKIQQFKTAINLEQPIAEAASSSTIPPKIEVKLTSESQNTSFPEESSEQLVPPARLSQSDKPEVTPQIPPDSAAKRSTILPKKEEAVSSQQQTIVPPASIAPSEQKASEKESNQQEPAVKSSLETKKTQGESPVNLAIKEALEQIRKGIDLFFR